jgi:hypothetical protein
MCLTTTNTLAYYNKVKIQQKKFYSKGSERNLHWTTHIRLGSKVSRGTKTLAYLSTVAMIIKKFYKNGT